jgi:peptide/nickel transport system ATP-binding protein
LELGCSLNAMKTLLSVTDLHVHFSGSGDEPVHALNGLSLELEKGTVLGILGESGSGKSTLAKTLLRMLPRNAKVAGGSAKFEGRNLFQLREREMNEIRGAQIAMVSQEPGMALNPVIKVGDQITEVLRAHRNWSGRQCKLEAESILERVNLRDGERRMYDTYPHQLSGGQQQRVLIGQALACNPSLIIADEPTASLDTVTEAEILDLFRRLRAERKTSLLLITHDPEILRGLADRVAVLYAGRIVEEAPAERIFQKAMHPYAKALLTCLPPALAERSDRYRFTTIPGSPPTGRLAEGCSFSPRCAERLTKCERLCPSIQEVEEQSRVECFLYDH